MTTLETLVFTPDFDPRITAVFAEVKALKESFETLV